MHQQYEVFTEDGSLRDSLRRMRERLDKLENPHQGEDYRIAADGEPGLCEICKEAHYTDEKCESLWQTPLDELTPTCGPEDYRPAWAPVRPPLWCRVHDRRASKCTAAGQPPATPGICPTCRQSLPVNPAGGATLSPPTDRTGG